MSLNIYKLIVNGSLVCCFKTNKSETKRYLVPKKKKKIVQIYSKKHEALSARLKNRTILFKSCIKYFYK